MKESLLKELKRLVQHFDKNKSIISNKEVLDSLKAYIELQECSLYYETVSFRSNTKHLYSSRFYL